MKALCWMSKHDVEVREVPDPQLEGPRDAILRITSTAICGSDLHLYDGFVPSMMKGDIMGHEFMGEVVDAGREVTNLKVGDRVVVPFPIACGQCWFCEHDLWSLCDNSNPNAELAEKMFGHAPSGIFGYSHMMGGFAGGQAQYVRVPFADVGPIAVPAGLTDEQVLFLSDILPTGWMAAENCNIQGGDTVAIWGAGPVGLLAAVSAWKMGAGRVIVIDRFDYRLELARAGAGAETLNYEQTDVLEELKQMTGGRGPDACIDAVGMEAHGGGIGYAVDRAKQALMVETDRPIALRETLLAVRKGGTVSVAGVYGGFVDTIPFGAIVNKALTIKAGQTHVHRYLRPLLAKIEQGELDPTFIISHRLPLSQAPDAYRIFRDKEDGCVKVVLDPWQ